MFSSQLKHLLVLARIALVHPSDSGLLSDISKTYQWLEQHNEGIEFRNCLVQHHSDALFLNVDDPDRDSWIWHSADELYINHSDSPDSKCWGVRKFLVPFHGLLRLAGVQEVRMSTAREMPLSVPEEELNLIRRGFNDQRLEGMWTDVKFTTDFNYGNQEFPAHRSFLASKYPYFKTQFCGSFRESDTTVEPITVPDCPADCLKWTLGTWLN